MQDRLKYFWYSHLDPPNNNNQEDCFIEVASGDVITQLQQRSCTVEEVWRVWRHSV